MQHRSVDNYEIIDELGHGGMAVVYRARDTKLDREVALKVLHEHIAGRDENRLRFEREAKAVAKLKHPNIITIYGFSSPSAPVGYIVSELIRGPTLRAFTDEHGFAHPEVAAMVVMVLAEALAHAHAVGVVHRDVKPENVMVDDRGVPKLMDFGLAQLLDSQKVTVTGSLMGSPAHMSAETIEGKPTDHRVDIFALGTVLYYMATRRLPFDGSNPAVVLNAILSGKYTPPSMVNPRVSDPLAKIIRTSMAREPEDRYATATHFADDLRTYLSSLGLTRPSDELQSFFADPETYNETLTTRLVEVLTEHATAKASQRQIAATLALCDRILELDPDNADALKLIGSMRKRRRSRELIAILAVLVLVAVGGWLVATQRTTPPPAEAGPSTSEVVDTAADTVDTALADAGLAVAGPVTGGAPRTFERATRLHAMAKGLEVATPTPERAQSIAAALFERAEREAERQAEERDTGVEEDVDEPIDTGSATAIVTALTPPADASETPEVPTHTVRITIYPQLADLFIDSARVDARAARTGIQLTEGRHAISARHPRTRRGVTEEINVVADAHHHLSIPWPSASLRVVSNRPGRVFFGDEYVGDTGDEIEVVMPERERMRELRLSVYPTEAGGDRYVEELELESGTDIVLNVEL